MKKIGILFFLPSLLLSIVCCDNNDNNDGIRIVEGSGQNRPELPDAADYDLNVDTIDDFQIDYVLGSWDGVDESGQLISGFLESLNESTVLVRSGENPPNPILFNRPEDTIWNVPRENFKWNDDPDPITITEIRQAADGIWPDEWSVNSEFNTNPYYLGIRVKEDEDFLVGWIKLEIDRTTGEISFEQFRLAAGEYIVIPE
ncbi:hypothetical protein [Ulvibacterium sp.]|uniref:hypothetical protein n=1 Tax=Ulvibacterium sp. TaxID=2665914 RepID=UPI002606A83E|nr:hypothetical protein [Ulvibacterium sp.]